MKLKKGYSELKRKNKNESGQSTTEFLLSLTLLLSFSMFFIQLCFLFAWGNYVHYATFMAARAFTAGGVDESDQIQRATDVITRMLKKKNSPGADRMPSVAKGVAIPGGADQALGLHVGAYGGGQNGGGFNRDLKSYSWLEGVRYRFSGRLFLIPLGGGVVKNVAAKTSKDNVLELTSES